MTRTEKESKPRLALENDLILRVARGESVERTPVWVMRQAGRVLSEYRNTRAKAGSFRNLISNPDLACEVTIQPVELLGVDAAILFSDILVIPEAMGLPYQMDEGRGPWFEKTVNSREDLENLSSSHIEANLSHILETIVRVKMELGNRVPLIGFAGAPWTIFCYMVEGYGSKTFSKSRALIARDPELAHALLRAITESTIHYLRAQVKNGCDMLQLFDSWAGVLNRDWYQQFAMPYLKEICHSLNHEVPLTIFAKGAFFSLEDLAALPCETLGIDWHTEPEMARNLAGANKTLQGNLDPAILYGSREFIKDRTREMLRRFGPKGHIANLGHGVYPDIERDNLRCFIDTVKEYQHKYE